MEQVSKKPFDKPDYNPVVFKTYKVIKKVVKYSICIAINYFAYKGFMAWK